MAGKLTTRRVETARPGMHGDGGCLWLRVMPSGSRQWLARVVVKGGGRHDIGLGGYPVVTLAEAREQALAARRMARKGINPVAERRKAVVPTFESAARSVHEEHKPTWRNPKHSKQWLTTLEQYAFPTIGAKPVSAIDGPTVREALLPIWLEKPETARRLRQRIGAVLDWAQGKGYRTGENPVRSIGRSLPKQPKDRGHFAALPYDDVSAFLERLRASSAGEPARLAFEFLILTATRTSETLNARWPEIDFKAETWTISPERTKAKRPHVVPLPTRCIGILSRAKELHSGQGDVVFESRPGEPFSNMVFLATLDTMGERGKVTPHGFRSAFRDWCSEATSFPGAVAEAALAHVVKDKTEAAYRRGDLLEKRRELMDAWARHCTEQRGELVDHPAMRRRRRAG
ncbi:MAG: DUF4102 domain-containing protein [Alphaproteobacteria bacterium]|nr:DUF4102 domain-containing protein [Alphaproteobacteria bacterium]